MRGMIVMATVAFALCACMPNDLTYPRTEAQILAFAVEGQKSSTINSTDRTVNIVLGERVDIENALVTSSRITDGASCASGEFPQAGDVLDLSDTLTYVLKVYYEYEWAICASQTIERYVVCNGQVAEPYINVEDRDVTIYVSENQSLESITITSMKLEREGAEFVKTVGYERNSSNYLERVEAEVSFPMTVNCALQRTFYIEDEGEVIEWTFSAVQKAVGVALSSVNAWTYHAEVEGSFNGSGTPYFAYRATGAEDWAVWEDVSIENGTAVSASISGLSEGTSYELKLCTEDSESEATTFTTGVAEQLFNMGWDEWYQVGKVWYPTSEELYNSTYANYASDSLESDMVWTTPNFGIASFNMGNPTIYDETFTATAESKYSVKMSCCYAVIKYAAGSVFTGKFIGLDGLGANLTWGTPFTGRPRAIHGYYAYTPGEINYYNNVKTENSGELDKAKILVILTDWDEPFNVNTTKGWFVDQENDEHIIAYSLMDSDYDTNGEFIEFEHELEYRRLDATPKYAVVIACASALADEFTGSTESVMWADEWEFVYD